MHKKGGRVFKVSLRRVACECPVENIFLQEVNPNGYVQQVDRSAFYDPECLVEYGFNR